MKKIKSVCVYCASSSQIPGIYFEAARRLGELLAARRIGCICGAGHQGLMGVLADTILAAGGSVTGVIPRFMYDEGWAHPHLTQLRITADMHERKQTMAALSEAAVALPGGCGTMEELLEIITWKQLGLYPHPVVILNTGGFYDPLIRQLRQAVDQSFMRAEHAALWEEARTPEEAVEALCRDREPSGGFSKHTARL
ncbi:MAG: TIGR00730 family Rossman fold protein [Coprobacter sp.]|nr:TIGR00730 family Rossman fold protein [Coprobacter sp.]